MSGPVLVLHRHVALVSTQDTARAMAAAGAPHGTIVLADHQTDGRGRRGRHWVGEPGANLLLSWILRPDVALRDAPLLTLGAAAGLAEALDVRVKWPNDLVGPDGHKLGGLLGEVEADGDRVRHVILGLGLNVNQVDFPGLPNATSLALLFGPQDREEVLDRVVGAVLAWSAHPDRLDLWRRRSHTLGRRVRIDGREGTATALRDDGALIVDGQAITTGEVE